MKKFLLAILTIILATVSYGQEIKFQKTFDETLSLARKEKKPVFMLITTKPNSERDSLAANYKSGLNTKKVSEFYNEKFVGFTTTYNDTAISKITTSFHPYVFPCYIFLDSNGGIAYTSGGDYLASQKFMEIANHALDRVKSGKTVGNFERLDKAGKLATRQQLKDYITLREELGMFDNDKLIERYVNLLTINELDNYNEVLFILKSGPIVYGKAYSLAYINKKVVDSVFTKEPLELRVDINRRIITNTRNEAIRTKNRILAENGASLGRISWNKDYRAGDKLYTYEMLNYYKAVNDTANFYMQAQYYYDNYYLSITTDSAKKLQSEAFDRIKNMNKGNLPPSSSMASYYTVLVQPAQVMEVASVLNNAAWDFYILGTHNANYLIKALMWSRRSIELQPSYNYYDTMAHILYRLNFYDEAILDQKKAIDMMMAASVSKEEKDKLNTELSKMKSHSL